MAANNQMPCDFCGAPYDPVSTRWLCPNCHMKTNCCDGAPCEIVEVKKGEIVALAGLVGAGRSEVARAIFGVDK